MEREGQKRARKKIPVPRGTRASNGKYKRHETSSVSVLIGFLRVPLLLSPLFLPRERPSPNGSIFIPPFFPSLSLLSLSLSSHLNRTRDRSIAHTIARGTNSIWPEISFVLVVVDVVKTVHWPKREREEEKERERETRTYSRMDNWIAARRRRGRGGCVSL